MNWGIWGVLIWTILTWKTWEKEIRACVVDGE